MSVARRTLGLVRYHLKEAAATLARGWRTSLLSLATIVAAVFVLGTVLLASSTLQRVLDRWGRAAELSIYMADTLSAGERATIEGFLRGSPLVDGFAFVPAEEAARRFATQFPDLAALATGPGAPALPASFEVRLRPTASGASEVADFVRILGALRGAVDVRYDRGLIERAARMISVGRTVAFLLAAVLALAAALAILSVVRLSYVARRDEVEILTLVGAPFTAIRGPFVAEGWLQGTVGAAVALAALAVAFTLVRARYGPPFVEATGVGQIEFLEPATWLGIVLVSGLLGAAAGAAAVERGLTETNR